MHLYSPSVTFKKMAPLKKLTHLWHYAVQMTRYFYRLTYYMKCLFTVIIIYIICLGQCICVQLFKSFQYIKHQPESGSCLARTLSTRVILRTCEPSYILQGKLFV